MLTPQRHAELIQQIETTLNQPYEPGASILQGIHPADIAEALRDFSVPKIAKLLNVLDDRRAATVLINLDRENTHYLLDHTSCKRISELLRVLPMDDAARVISELPPAETEKLLTELAAKAPEHAAKVRLLLTYNAQTAGRLMTNDFVRLPAALTVDQAFDEVRQADSGVETLTDLYVIERAELSKSDSKEKLVGVVSLRDLVRNKGDKHIAEIMATKPITVTVDTDQEEVARLISKYDFLAMPVLDRDGMLAGIITVDDIIHVLVEEGTEDILKANAISVEPGVINKPYFSTPLWRVVKSRVGWLVLLFVAETATGTVLRYFEDELAKVVALSFFIPLLIGTGGNTGAQTVSTIIRGLALREIKTSDTLRVMMRELCGGLMLGVLLGLIGFGRSMIWGSGVQLSMVVGLTILVICTWANTIGSLIPLVAQRLKIDPALVSAPLITTLVDATGLAIYMLIAKALITALH